MSKRPQSVYLDESVHSEAMALVDNALDGHGSLAGFVDFVEQSIFDVFAHMDPHSLIASEAFSNYFETSTNELCSYVTRWEAAAPTLPWHHSRPAASHSFALFLMAHDPRWWSDTFKEYARYGRPAHYRTLHDWGLDDLERAVWHMQLRGKAGSPPSMQLPEIEAAIPAVWRRNRLEFAPYLEARKPKPTSFYLEPEAHTFVQNVFGSMLYSSLEGTVRRVLLDRRNWLDITPETRFLEHGTEGLTLEGHRQRTFLNWVKAMEGDFGPNLRRHVRERVERPFWEKPDDGGFPLLPNSDEFGWDLAFYPGLRLASRLGLVDVGAIAWNEVSNRSKHDVVASAVQEASASILPAFMERYHLQSVLPESRVAFEVLLGQLQGASPWDELDSFQDPVDFHVFRLFQLYAQSVLPEHSKLPLRTSLRALATLAQSWVFPTRSALSAYSASRAGRRPDGIWTLTKGRRVIMELTNQDAFHVGKMLWAVIPPVVDYAYDERFLGVLDYDTWIERSAWLVDDLDDDIDPENVGRLSLDLGSDLIELALGVLRSKPERPKVALQHVVLDRVLGREGHLAARLEAAYEDYYFKKGGSV